MIRCLIVDDEDLAREGVALHLRQEDDLEVVGTCADGHAAVGAIRALRPDLVFLDVQMPEVDGFDVVERIGPEKMPLTIFVTAFDEHAVHAFEAQALDYLLKPVDGERLARAVERARRTLQERTLARAATTIESLERLLGGRASAPAPEEPAPDDDYARRLIARSHGRTRVVRVDDVDWAEADDDYVHLHGRRGEVMLRESLTSLERRLDPAEFRRIHKRYLVRLDAVVEVRPEASGTHRVRLRDGSVLRLGRSYRRAFDDALAGS